MENKFSQERLDLFIEKHLNLQGNKLVKAFTEGRKYCYYTENLSTLHSGEVYENALFTNSNIDRFIHTVLGSAIMIGCTLAPLFGAPVFVLCIGLFGGINLILTKGVSSERNELEINFKGITYNDRVYPWANIEKTLIVGETRNRESDEVHLVLALRDGKIRMLDVTDLYLKKNNHKIPSVGRSRLISYFVEYFKNQFRFRER